MAYRQLQKATVKIMNREGGNLYCNLEQELFSRLF